MMRGDAEWAAAAEETEAFEALRATLRERAFDRMSRQSAADRAVSQGLDSAPIARHAGN